jgi:hypothetical protein
MRAALPGVTTGSPYLEIRPLRSISPDYPSHWSGLSVD